VSLRSVAITSVLGALMYFSTLTEVPIVDALLGAGMGKVASIDDVEAQLRERR